MELQWPLILFTTFIAWSAGLFAAQAVYALQGKAPKSQMPALIASVVLLAVGGIAVFFHLEHWERIFNGFGHLTSGITQELIAIVIMAVIMVVYFVYLRQSGKAAKVPAWTAILAIVSAAALVVVMAHSYMMASRPAWSTVLWIVAVLGNACVFGPATMALIASLQGEGSALDGTMNLAGSIANAVCSGTFLVHLATVADRFMQVEYYYDLTHPMKGIESFISPFMSGSAPIIWLGVVLIGLAGPIVCAILGKRQKSWKIWGTAALVCALIGALCLRVVFYQAGSSVFMFY